MKKKAIITTIAAVSLVAVVGIGSTLAYFTDSDTEENTVTFGFVDIELVEENFDTEDEEQDNRIYHIVPNTPIDKDPTIIAQAGSEDMYLRVRIDVGGALTDMPILEDADGEARDYVAELLEGIDIDTEKWVYNEDDGYYYYQEPVTDIVENRRIPVFTTVTIPEKWGNEVADKTFTIDVSAEAIQADSFNPHTTNGVIDGWKYTDGSDVTVEGEEEPIPVEDNENTME